jgi:hypothetical protein
VNLHEELGQAIVGMAPRHDVTQSGWCLGRDDDEFLIDPEAPRGDSVAVTLPEGQFRVTWFDAIVDSRTDGGIMEGGADARLPRRNGAAWLRRID